MSGVFERGARDLDVNRCSRPAWAGSAVFSFEGGEDVVFREEKRENRSIDLV